MEFLDFSRKNGNSRFSYEKRENWQKRVSRVSGMIGDSGENTDIVDNRDYKDAYIAAAIYRKFYMGEIE